MKQTRSFAHSPESVTEARRFANEALGSVPPEALDVITLMVSELASNCIRHARTGFDLTITRSATEVRVEATDDGGGEPRMRYPGPADPTGRGLQIIDMLSGAWGVQPVAGAGKTVWFTVATEAPARAEKASA